MATLLLNSLPTLLKVAVKLSRELVKPATMHIETILAIKAYSIDVAPDSSDEYDLQKLIKRNM